VAGKQEEVTGNLYRNFLKNPFEHQTIEQNRLVPRFLVTNKFNVLTGMPYYDPTVAEIWTYPAEELAARIS
jgi:hypothetical protein